MVFKILGRFFGSLFSSLGRGFSQFFRWIGRHEAALGIFTVAFVAIIAVWVALSLLEINIVIGKPPTQTVVVNNIAPTASPQATAAPTSPAQVARNNAPASTELFMTGQINGNAEFVWNSLGAALHNRLSGEGRDKGYFERRFESQRQSGLVFDSYQYIGGVPSTNGTSIHFYVLNVQDSDKKTTKIPWTFIVDNEGKIASLESVAS